MEKKQLVFETVRDISGREMTVIAQTLVYSWKNRGLPYFTALKKPLYLVIKETDGQVTTFDIDGRVIAAERILSGFPEAKILLL